MNTNPIYAAFSRFRSTLFSISRRREFAACLLRTAVLLMICNARPILADAVYTWGYNRNGQLGDGTTTSRSTPLAVSGALTGGVSAIAGGAYHSLAVRNGGVYAWGDNFYGQLGDGTTTDRSTPSALGGVLSSGVTSVACGGNSSLALQNGGIYTWGFNGDGALGDGTSTSRSSPVALTGALSSGVTAVAGCLDHSLALKNGGVYAWGYNGNGGVGDGTIINRSTPVALTGILSSGVTNIAGGGNHSLAVRNGGVYTWGRNIYGQLGDGMTTDRSTPFPMSGLLSSGVTCIAGGAGHSLAVRNGNVFAWGANNLGQLGDGTTLQHSTPEQIDSTDLTNIVAVTAGTGSSYALSADGSLWTWGFNVVGQLGLGNSNTPYLTPQHLLPPTGYVFTSIVADVDGIHAVATVAAVPEPANLALIALTACALFARRHKAGRVSVPA